MRELLYNTIVELTKSGKIFSANFTKADGTEREMVCRVGVQKGLKGVGANYDRAKVHNLCVWDMKAQGYRTIKTDRLNSIKIEGKVYNFNQ